MAVTINGSGVVDVGANASSSAYVRLYEDTDNGTNYVDLIAPSSIASNKTITLPDVTGTAVTTGDTGSITSTMLATAVKPLGVGQSYTDVTASRAIDTTYTNSTGRPIFIVVTVSGYNGGAPRSSAAGRLRSPFRPRNSTREPEYPTIGSLLPTDTTRPENSLL